MTPQNEVIFQIEVVQRINKVKFLGVVVNQLLYWKDHAQINDISKKKSTHVA